MIKKLKAWLASRRRAIERADFDRGYAYAADLLLKEKGSIDPRHHSGYAVDYGNFDRGIDAACKRYEALTGNTIGQD